MASHRLALPEGYRLENYLFMQVLGKGGFGITYQARDLQLNRPVAVKELLPDSIATRVDGSTVVAQSETHESDWTWAKDRFLREAQMVASFRHPNIVHVHRLLAANGTIYMIMDFLDGGSYEDRLKRIGHEPDEASLRAVIDPVLDGLVEVHKAGLLHRDIKPDNILFNHRGEPVLADFGAARELVGRTVALTSIITPGYSPLEQYQSSEKLQGAWTDIYALGAVMARAITGSKPPASTDRLGKDDYPSLAAKPRAGFSRECLKAVDLALRMKPQDRPQSIEAWRKMFTPPTRPQGQSLLLVVPKGGERWEIESEQKIRWKRGGPEQGEIKTIDVELWKGSDLVETIASGLDATATQCPWKIPTGRAEAGDYQIRLVARGFEGQTVTTAAAGKFSIIPKRVPPPPSFKPNRTPEPIFEKVFSVACWLAFMWLVFFGGWRVVWAKVFPHLPNSTITWMKDQHPAMVPAGELDQTRSIYLLGSGLNGGKFAPLWTPSPLHSWDLAAPKMTATPSPTPVWTSFGSLDLKSTPAVKSRWGSDSAFPANHADPEPEPEPESQGETERLVGPPFHPNSAAIEAHRKVAFH